VVRLAAASAIDRRWIYDARKAGRLPGNVARAPSSTGRWITPPAVVKGINAFRGTC
jgi:hypothetical protein